MMGAQCDTCRTFAPTVPAGWFILARIEPPSAFSGLVAALSAASGTPDPDDPKTFCSIRCVADYAYAKAVTGGSPS